MSIDKVVRLDDKWCGKYLGSQGVGSVSSDKTVERRHLAVRGLLNVHANETVRSNPRSRTSYTNVPCV